MRLAIISDIHEDIITLKKILKRIAKEGHDQLVCLGDVSGFSVPHYTYHATRNAHDCLSLLRENQAIILPGNHDFHASGRIPLESDIFDFPDDWYEMDYRDKQERAGGQVWIHELDDLDPLYMKSDLEFLSSLPEYRVLETGTRRILLSHYVFPNLSGFQKGFYMQEKEFLSHFGFMKEKNCEISFTGHAHVRGIYTATIQHFRHYRYKPLLVNEFPVCIGIMPVTRQLRRSGFCIFDSERSVIEAVKYL